MKKPELKQLLKKLAILAGIFLLVSLLLGLILSGVMHNLAKVLSGGGIFALFSWALFAKPETYILGATSTAVLCLVYFATAKNVKIGNIFKTKSNSGVKDSALENSRWMTEKERDFNFPAFTFKTAREVKKDGVPVRAVLNKKNELEINVFPGAHGLIIGATGSGKTTTFINPTVQIIAESSGGSSMILTDPKGELFSLHSEKLKQRGYDVKVLDLRDTYSSYRWNPLNSIFEMYQDYATIGKSGIKSHTDSLFAYEALAKQNNDEDYGERWFEWEGKAYADKQTLLDDITVAKQKIYDEMYEDLNDLVSVICPIESADDPVWEKGARSIMMATLIAMLEDSENPELGMTKEKFNFFNLNKALGNSEDNFKVLKDYFTGRGALSGAVTLSRQVLSAAESTLSSYMSIAFDKLSMFNDKGLCALTSATDINPFAIADQPTALFMKIPDEKDTRHTLASVFILCVYKALIKKASSREDLSLPRNVYFLLDEFGNMPKIEKFDKMITVGRSRKIWFHMVVQSYAQLNNVYGDTVADIVKSNCAMKMFIGSNDIDTCKEFSELCGNMTVSTSSVSTSTSNAEVSMSQSLQTRPLIYPSELQKLNNKSDTGNAIIVSFGNYPMRTKFTPSYKCDYYSMGQMDISELRRNIFRPEEVFYDLAVRNNKIQGEL